MENKSNQAAKNAGGPAQAESFGGNILPIRQLLMSRLVAIQEAIYFLHE